MIKRILKKMIKGVPVTYGTSDANLVDVDGYEDANLITSIIADQPPNRTNPEDEGLVLHAPVLDIDYEISVMPSTTPGHYHLYIEKPLTWHDYQYLLLVLAKLGLIEKGFASASIARGFTSIRLPWERKETDPSKTDLICNGCDMPIKSTDLIRIQDGGFAHFICKSERPGPKLPPF